jgi:hypothetical protein
MSEDVARKIKALIEHAVVEPTTNEARNAAVRACRLIRLHKLVLIAASNDEDGDPDPVARTARIVGEVLGGMAHEYGRARRRR